MRRTLLLGLFATLAISVKAQTWTPVSGRWQYQFMKIDSLALLPGGNTATRKAASAAKYAIRYNTDSSAFEYSDGTKWWNFAIKPASDFVDDGILTGTEARDTTLTFTCGTQTLKYVHYVLPQFIGFRVRVSSLFSLFDDGPVTFCLFEGTYTVFNSQTGDLYIINVDDTPGNGYYYRVAAY